VSTDDQALADYTREQNAINDRWCAIRDRLVALDIPVGRHHAAWLGLEAWEKLLDKAEQGGGP
jgi:hypothetical protein